MTFFPRSICRVRFAAAAMVAAWMVPAASIGDPGADTKTYANRIQPFLKQHCVECHDGEKPKGKFHVAQLNADFADEAARKQWLAVRKRILAGEMPPKAKPRPAKDDVMRLAEWIGGRADEAAAAQRLSQGRVALRRLNRVEYENTIRDLLKIDVDLQDLLPPDTSTDGFDNVADALHVSSFLMDRYLEAADKALNLAIANNPQPPLIKKRFSLRDSHQFKSTTEKVFRTFDETGVVMFSSSAWQALSVTGFYPPDRGRYRFRISSYGIQSGGKPVTYRIDAGPMLMATKNHLVGYFDAPADKPDVVEFVDHLEARSTIRLLPFELASAQAVNKVGADKFEGPGLAVEWIEVEGPLHDTWPPESHRRVFGDLPQESARMRDYPKRVEVVSKDHASDLRQVLLNFCQRAYRRTVNTDDINPLVKVVEQKLTEGYSFEQAVRVGLKGALVSPDFLFLRERPGRLDDFALASRLSYFLWSTMPDEELFALADDSQLRKPEVLRQQVERMLASPKAGAFTENFTGQWLKLRDIDFTEPDHLLYPEFDDMLKAAMTQEARLFFNEVLANNLSLTNFAASDFTMLNERLARHYGIPDVKGHAFRKVNLPPDSHRGGVMTMAGVLKVTANGTSTSPVVRGAWVLDRILGTPPPNPPDGVPAIEPDIRGATTIREQLNKHRENESCASCHRLIDPPGVALESFDVIGGWRENYRSLGRGKPVTINGRRMHYADGPPVDPTDVLTDGRKFYNIDQYKQLLLENKDQLARALAVKLLTYGTGGAPQAADQPQINAIVDKIRDKDYGFRSLIHEIVQSELFQQK